jgi:hypothetical protein
MLGMLKRHEIEILLKAGHPKTEMARLAQRRFETITQTDLNARIRRDFLSFGCFT